MASPELEMTQKLGQANRDYTSHTAERAATQAIEALADRNQAEDLKIMMGKLDQINKLGFPKVDVPSEGKATEKAPAREEKKVENHSKRGR